MNVPRTVFRQYDVRGIVGKELTPDFARALGRAFATAGIRKLRRAPVHVAPEWRVAVGGLGPARPKAACAKPSKPGEHRVRAEPIIALRGVNKYYRSGDAPLHVLRDVDLSVGGGELVSIMGSSGSGKSTLLNILGLLDDHDRGTYHLAGLGDVSWCGFAREVFRASSELGGPSASVTPISTADYPTPAARPKNSRLDCGKAEQMFGVALPDWREGVRECVTRLLAK